MKLKRLLPLVLSLAMAGGVFAGVAGCNKGSSESKEPPTAPTEHEHRYTGWQDNGDGTHSPKCVSTTGTCDAPVKTAESDKEEHKYDGDADTTCNKCGYVRTISGGEASTPLPASNKIYVVGDSTVCSFNDNYYLPRYGYGTQLVEYLNVTSDQIVNLAMSGRSSKSFLTETNYQTLKTSIAEGDYLIIGFGHNDEKQGEAETYRYTNPNGDYTTEGSFQKSLYDNYVKLAVDKGATPILCTPIVRYDKTGEYTGNSVHVTNDKDSFKGGDYSAAIRSLGTDTKTTVIDLTTLTKVLYLKDNDEAKYYHAFTSYDGEKPDETPKSIDTTHINKYGAKAVAYEFAKALKATDNSLKKHVKDDIAAPTKAVDYPDAIKTDYVRPPYNGFIPSANESRKLTGDWYHAAMGNLGGDKAGDFTFSESEGKITVGTDKNTGKFQSNDSKDEYFDGFGAAFMQIGAERNFTFSATVKVINLNASAINTQSGFGIMVRDDIYLDVNDGSLNSNYASAGILSSKGEIFYGRQDKKMVKGTNKLTCAVGSTYQMSIVKENQTIVVSIGDEKYTWTDLDLISIDNDYVYICLFANRGITAEFSNLQYQDTGLSSKA
ncbi:MAG: GDSL-type esterase/lipase family protein [Roseburia sp.]|nr:GDSL-type esterase/lipase family protein [Roseburia sp.]